ncbi:MAG: hypothetical protein IJ086_15045 [Clostridium sp.]|nr:hypothetical protein [Clostridium sp.]
MKSEFKFRGYILESEFEKKQIIIKELVGNICDKYICAKVDNNIIECKRLSLKLHKLLNKFDNLKLYKFVSYKDSFINEILASGLSDYKKYNKEIKDIQYFFNK